MRGSVKTAPVAGMALLLLIACGGKESGTASPDSGASLLGPDRDSAATPPPPPLKCSPRIAAYCAQQGADCPLDWNSALRQCTQFDLVSSHACGGYDVYTRGGALPDGGQDRFYYDAATGELVGIVFVTGNVNPPFDVYCSVPPPFAASTERCTQQMRCAPADGGGE